MADDFRYDIVVNLATRGVKQAKGDIEGATKAVDELARTGGVSEKAFESFTRAAQRAGQSTEIATKNLPRLRYALFDVSSTLAVTGAAMTGVSVAAAGLAISMDRAFADVIRTTETFGAAANQAAGLRAEFENLFTSMPTSWADLTDIGTLAGQLNIARDSVAEFTQLVAMFAATTDVSVEQSATAFGRLSQLLKVPADELQNLGSSILAVGVNSIATESQIIAISTQITSMASTAGFTADQVFGLSAALASLGTQPELSRGVITRLFSNITVAINDGSDRLEAFGRVAGMTGDEFARAWGDNASQALLTLVEGLGSLDQTKAVATLNELGITAARDVPTILRLAQNSEVLADSLQVAAQGYADGTALQEQYSVITSTVAEKLNILVNNFQNLIATAGAAAGGLGFVVDAAIGLTKALNDIIDNPVAGAMLGIVVAATALVGIVSLLGALVTRSVAGLIAFRTVSMELAASGFTASAGLSSMTAALTGVTASSGAATVATRALGIALKSLPVIGLVLAGASIAFDILGESMKTASERAQDFFGDLSGFGEALKADNAADYAGQVFGEISLKSQEAEKATDSNRAATEEWLGVQSEVAGTTDTATAALQDQTLVLGENADAWIRNALASNETIQKIANDPALQSAFTDLGFNINSWIAASLEGPDAAAAYLEQIRTKALELQESMNLNPGDVQWQGYEEALRIVDELTGNTNALIQAQTEQANTASYLGIATTDAAAGMDELSNASLEALDSLFEVENAALNLQSNIFSLGESLYENGNSFDYFSEAGRANMGALLQVMDAIAAQTPGDAAATASALQGLFNFIVDGGYASASQLGVLSNAIATLSGGAKVVPTAFNAQSFFGGWSSGAEKAAKSTQRAGRSAREAAKEVRTLVDYGNDLDKVFSRAFDLRFSGGSTLDEITSTFIGMREATEDSARSIQKLKAEIQGLQSDLSIQEYFLSIAIEYGDTQRAQAIQANIAKLQADLADKTADLSDEQGKNSKTLTGNSKAAIDNRKQMEALVKQYQDHITALASSGLSQSQLAQRTAELKEQFIQQATQLGYSRGEIEQYSLAFDDMVRIINTLPRNITLSVNADPAITALAEYEAAINRARSNASQGIQMGAISNPTNGKEVRRAALEAQVAAINAQMQIWIASGLGPAAYSLTPIIATLAANLKSGNYWTGGYTGSGGKYEPAGVVHRGEYVIPKKDVNQRTGLPNADALGRLQRGAPGRSGYAGGGFVTGGRGNSLVQIGSLGPMAQQQFGQLFDSYMRVYLDGRTIADSSSRQYAQSTATGAA